VKPEERTPGEYGTGGEKTRRVWNRKREDQENVEPEERRPGECGTGRTIIIATTITNTIILFPYLQNAWTRPNLLGSWLRKELCPINILRPVVSLVLPLPSDVEDGNG
jgi:hypothetical protein